ncbi:hypothetical protein HYV87_04360 [Candidatus Woesearchaeota archaeon]|nr:hypothetical protein [Candidatus Woesearchaeota archaeon]
MKKSVSMLLLVILIALFLVSCKPKPGAGDSPRDTAAALQQVKTGTQGVEIKLLQDSPPSLLYDQNELIALVEVKNRGNYDLKAQECFIQIGGFDPNIISGGFSSPRSCAESLGVLEGKNLYNTEGSTNLLEFESTINLPAGVPDYSPTLNFLSCYKYHTIANPSVCVDPLFYQVSAEQKTCRLQNLGGGRVLSPFANIQNCGQASLEYRDLDQVGYNVEMTGGGKINCKPNDGFVRLVNNQGKIICSFNIPGAAAFETLLLVDLDYGYIESQQKSIKIIKTPQ